MNGLIQCRRGRLGAALLAAALLVAGCAVARAPEEAPPGALAAPEWQPGDRWLFEWTSGEQRGTKTVEVLERQSVNGMSYYVARIDPLSHYFTLELGWAAGVRDAKVEARMVPPEPYFVWPLAVGRHWEHHGTYESAEGRRDQVATFTVVGRESIEVPAGRFEAVHVVRRTNQRDFDEYWYVPEVRWYAKWVGRRGDAQFEERLREYHPVPRDGAARARPSVSWR
jgi:hypothetical protein